MSDIELSTGRMPGNAIPIHGPEAFASMHKAGKLAADYIHTGHMPSVRCPDHQPQVSQWPPTKPYWGAGSLMPVSW